MDDDDDDGGGGAEEVEGYGRKRAQYSASRTTLALFSFLLFIVLSTTGVSLWMIHRSSTPDLMRSSSSSSGGTPRVVVAHKVLEPRPVVDIVEHPKLSAVGTVRSEDLQFVVRTYPEVLSAEECEAMIDMARATGAEQQPSAVQTTQDPAGRHSFGTSISIMQCTGRFAAEHGEGCAALRKVYGYMSVISGYPTSHMEPLNLVRYDVGQYFSTHEDSLPAGSREMKLLGSQRAMSMLLYLSAVEEGGETQFIDINLRITPEVGKTLVWRNTPASRHESGLVKSGVKWVAVLFVHDKELPAMFM